MEFLESRLAPAQVHWVGGGEDFGGVVIDGHEWGYVPNWLEGRVPDINDDVFIPAPTTTHPWTPNIDNGDEFSVRSINSIVPGEGAESDAKLEIDYEGILNIVGGTSEWKGAWLGEDPSNYYRREGRINLIDAVFNWRGGNIKLQSLTLRQSHFNVLQEADRLSVDLITVGYLNGVYPIPSTFNLGSEFAADAMVGNIRLHDISTVLGAEHPLPVVWDVNYGSVVYFKQAQSNGQKGGIVFAGITEYGVLNKGAWFTNYGEIIVTGGVAGVDWVRIDPRIKIMNEGVLRVFGSMSTALVANRFEGIEDINPWKIFVMPSGKIEVHETGELRTVGELKGILLTKDSELVAIGEAPRILGDVSVAGGSLTIYSEVGEYRNFLIIGEIAMEDVLTLTGSTPEEINSDFYLYIDISGTQQMISERLIVSYFANHTSRAFHFYGTTIGGPQTYGWEYIPLDVVTQGGLTAIFNTFTWDSPLQPYEALKVADHLLLKAKSALLGQPSATSPGFTTITGFGYGGSYMMAPAGPADADASWTFTGLEDGVYQVYATWLGGPSFSNGVSFFGYDGVVKEQDWIVDQQVASDQVELYGTLWNSLGTINVNTGSLTVILESVLNGAIFADAIMIVKVG